MGLLVGVVVAVAAAVIAPVGLTMHGARRRGRGPLLAVAAGIALPFTWLTWYLLDEHPFRRTAVAGPDPALSAGRSRPASVPATSPRSTSPRSTQLR
jgi:hypothetical protein